MKRILFSLIFLAFSDVYAQSDSKLHLGLQSGLAIPRGSFSEVTSYYTENGYASTGVNLKLYGEYNVKGSFFIGANYLYFQNGMSEGNLSLAANTWNTSNIPEVVKPSKTHGVLLSGLFKGKETPLFIKAFWGMAKSSSAEIKVTDAKGYFVYEQKDGPVASIAGLGIGFYVPIRNTWYIELEADYISSTSMPQNFISADNQGNRDVYGSINYSQEVININVGVGFFLFND